MSEKITTDNMPADVWEGEMGDKWLKYLDQFEGMLSPVGEALAAASGAREGETIIDIGCGGGGTSFELARIVGPAGSVTGLDISPRLVGESQRRAAAMGFGNVNFIVGDASKVKIPGPGFDRLFSRFGVMFFADPYAAFKNMHGFIKPGGELVFGCWGPPSENAWVSSVMQIAAKYVDLPAPVPRAPGPMAFAEPEYVTDILGKAGFTDVTVTPWRGDQLVGGKGAKAEDAARFIMDALFMGELLADQPGAIKAAAEAETHQLLSAYETPEGVKMPCMAWFVTAKA